MISAAFMPLILELVTTINRSKDQGVDHAQILARVEPLRFVADDRLLVV